MVVPRPPALAALEFQGKHHGEEFQLYFHQHWIRLVWPLTKVLVWNTLIFGSGYVTFFFFGIEDVLTRRFLLTFFCFSFLLSNFEFLCRLYRYFLYVVVVTDKKIHRIKKTLLTTDDHQSIDLWVLQDINRCQHSVIQNLFGFGTIILEAQETVLRVHFVPRIEEKYERIMHLREQARMAMMYGGTRYAAWRAQTPAVSPMEKDRVFEAPAALDAA